MLSCIAVGVGGSITGRCNAQYCCRLNLSHMLMMIICIPTPMVLNSPLQLYSAHRIQRNFCGSVARSIRPVKQHSLLSGVWLNSPSRPPSNR